MRPSNTEMQKLKISIIPEPQTNSPAKKSIDYLNFEGNHLSDQDRGNAKSHHTNKLSRYSRNSRGLNYSTNGLIDESIMNLNQKYK